jgi:hypothetical protein
VCGSRLCFRVFILSAGIVHAAASKSISDHCAARALVSLTPVRATNARHGALMTSFSRILAMAAGASCHASIEWRRSMSPRDTASLLTVS